jgi:hypothetical protein
MLCRTSYSALHSSCKLATWNLSIRPVSHLSSLVFMPDAMLRLMLMLIPSFHARTASPPIVFSNSNVVHVPGSAPARRQESIVTPILRPRFPLLGTPPSRVEIILLQRLGPQSFATPWVINPSRPRSTIASFSSSHSSFLLCPFLMRSLGRAVV